MTSARSVLIGFMKEMREWELKCAKREHDCDEGKMDYHTAVTLAHSDYIEIFSTYCSRNAAPREYYFTEPPDYDSEREVIVEEIEIRPGTIHIRTQQSYSHNKSHLFTIVLEDGGWRVLERKVVLDNGELLDSSL